MKSKRNDIINALVISIFFYGANYMLGTESNTPKTNEYLSSDIQYCFEVIEKINKEPLPEDVLKNFLEMGLRLRFAQKNLVSEDSSDTLKIQAVADIKAIKDCCQQVESLLS